MQGNIDIIGCSCRYVVDECTRKVDARSRVKKRKKEDISGVIPK
jgi:hypothetical protein